MSIAKKVFREHITKVALNNNPLVNELYLRTKTEREIIGFAPVFYQEDLYKTLKLIENYGKFNIKRSGNRS